MKKENLLFQLYAEHFKKNFGTDWNTHGFRYVIELIDPSTDTLEHERGLYLHANIDFKNSLCGMIYIDNEDGSFLNYRLVLGSSFHTCLQACQYHRVSANRSFQEKHSTIQGCIDEIEKVRSYITDFFIL